jgi:GNAT superfamily N-acetyltransferase
VERPSELTTRPISPPDFGQIERLFGANGACGGCWCMFWRVPSGGAYWAEHKGEDNRQAFRALVESGRARGCLAFDGDLPVGWCSFGPREDFAYFARSRSIPDPGLPGVWAITCFYVRASHRNRGVSEQLIACAIREAARAGAAHLEGYPTEPKSPRPIPPAFAHTGVPGPFLRLGFRRVADAGARSVMRLTIGASTAAPVVAGGPGRT